MKVFAPLALLAVMSEASATGSAAQSPVEKVVKLLEELQASLENDQKVELQMYNRFACWCETSTGAKAAAIIMANNKIVTMTQKVLELKGLVAVLSKEVADFSAKIAENEGSQKDATSVRSKENAEYMAEKEELELAINALERAIKVLSGAGTKSLLQGADAQLLRQKALASVRSAVRSLPALLPANAKWGPKQLAAIESFATEFESAGQPEGVTAATADASYNPASAQVQGILKDMYDSFTAELESNTNTEAASQRDFEDLIATLAKEVNTMNEQIIKREEKKADASQELAEKIQELDDTKATMEADIDFFDKTKAACKAKHEEWTVISEGRLEEIKGIKKALKILTSDEARALFAKATSTLQQGSETMFMQLDTDSSMSDSATKAYNALKAGARKAHSLRLASLAAAVRTMGTSTGWFDKVIEKIDEMIDELKKEEKEDIKQRDWCKDEYHVNAEEKADLKWKITNNEATITKLEEKINELNEEITKTVEEIKTTKAQIEQMEEERKAEHEEFKTAKEDDEAAIKLLKKAKEVLSKEKFFIQEPEFESDQWQAPDATFSGGGQRKNQKAGIVGIMEMIIEDLESEIKDGIKDEVAAQGEFEKNVDAAKHLISELQEKKDNLEEDKAAQEEKKSDEEKTMEANKEDLQINEEYKQKITPDCDWMLNSFEERKEKRLAEMNGLVTAKEYLAGGKPSMMQASVNFDDTKLQHIGFESLRR